MKGCGFLTVVCVAVLALLIRTFVFEPYKIPTGAMKPTLMGNEYDENGKKIRDGDRLIANKFIYFFTSPKRGDIVVFSIKGIEGISQKKKDFIKRVVGLPGETVEIKNGQVYINDNVLVEPEIFETIPYIGDIGNALYGTTGHPAKVPENCYFVLGDNSANSNDSRYWGFVPRRNIKGKAIWIYSPSTRRGRLR
jgi:signal peptidase I